jgi:predicted nucleic acid-binding protein
VVLGELLSGFAAGQRETENRRELGAFLDSARVRLLPVEADTAEFYSRVYLNLRRKGRPIPTNDLWIAAAALQHGAAIFSHDQHFREVDGLIVGARFADFLL